MLDGVRFARTDASGRFRFEGVPWGRHLVEARVTSDQPTFFTTPSPAEVDAGASVDFGIGLIAFERQRLFAHRRRSWSAWRGGPRRRLRSAGHRAFGRRRHVRRREAAGREYEVTIEAGSVPAGYPLDGIEPQRVEVKADAPGRATFVLQPYRSVSGRARLFNRQSGQYVALTGARVELQPLGRKSVTDTNGLYTFRDLPAGDYTVVASHDKQEHLVVVTVPVGPAFMKDIDVAVVPRGDLIAESSAGQDRTARARAIAIDARRERAVSAEPQGSKPALTVAGSFTIQVAASANLRHARAMVSELRGRGHAAYLVEALSGGGARHQVRVGHYPTLSEADGAASNLERALGWRLRVTTDVPPHSSTSLSVQGTPVSNSP